jgi:hypothetical protein
LLETLIRVRISAVEVRVILLRQLEKGSAYLLRSRLGRNAK